MTLPRCLAAVQAGIIFNSTGTMRPARDAGVEQGTERQRKRYKVRNDGGNVGDSKKVGAEREDEEIQ